MMIKIESTESGEVFNVKIEQSMESLKYQLSLLTSTSPQDQIILFGPPFKILDAHFGPNLDISEKRVFVFNRRILSDVSIEPLITSIPHKNIDISTLQTTRTQSDPPITLSDYEKRFRIQLEIEQQVEKSLKELTPIYEKFLSLNQVQIDGTNAAISNLRDIFSSVKKSYETLEEKICEQQKHHLELVLNFESNLNKLIKIELHPAIKNAINKHKMENLSASYSQAEINTLYDCIPADRERAFLKQCADNHYKVEDNLRRVRSLFADISERVSALRAPPPVGDWDDELGMNAVFGLVRDQTEAVSRCRRSYQVAYEAAQSDSESVEEVDMLASLRNLWTESQTGGMAVVDRLQQVSRSKARLEEAQLSFSRMIFSTLRRVAVLQTEIQFKLKKDVDWMKRLSTGKNEYFSHLEQLASLPKTYSHLLKEISRRNSYNKLFESHVDVASEKISSFRNTEIKERELFMQTHGHSLPPIFFKVISTLKEKPPYFSLTVTEPQILPEINVLDVSHTDADSLDSFCLTDNMTDTTLQLLDRVMQQSDGPKSGSVILPAATADRSVERGGESSDREERYEQLSYAYSQLQRRYDDLLRDSQPLHSTPTQPLLLLLQTETVVEEVSSETCITLSQLEELLLVIRDGQSELYGGSSLLGLDSFRDEAEAEKCCCCCEWMSTVVPLDKQGRLTKLFKETLVMTRSVAKALQHQQKHPKITFKNFQVGDIALFVPHSVENRQKWTAFHSNSPYRFLSDESLEPFLSNSKKKEQRAHILARIIFIETKITTEEYNPYELSVGTEFYICVAEAVKPVETNSGESSISMKLGDSVGDRSSSNI